MSIQLETCHLGKPQGTQVTRMNPAHAGARPRLTDDQKELIARQQAFVRQVLGQGIVGLDTRPRNILRMRYLDRATEQHLPALLKVSQPRIYQLEEEALRQLRKIFAEDL